MADLTGVPLSEALAEALGRDVEVLEDSEGNRRPCVKEPGGGWRFVPQYHASVDALLRDVWPVLRERGFDAELKLLPLGATVHLFRFQSGEPPIKPFADADTLAEAFARACLRALKEGTE